MMTVKTNKQQFLCINSFLTYYIFSFFYGMPNSFVSILKEKVNKYNSDSIEYSILLQQYSTITKVHDEVYIYIFMI